MNFAIHVIHDAKYQCQPQSGADTGILGGKERLEDLGL